MKKTRKWILTTILLVLQVFCFKMPDVYALEDSDIFSNEALVVDMETDEVLYSKNTKAESVEIASLTKIMTYILTVENIEDLNTKIIVPLGTKQDIIDQNGSNAGLEDGYEYTALDLLYGLMLPSGCDAADVLAEYISNNNYSEFVRMMNEKAVELGMNDTTFYSASGLEENGMNNVSTEQDLYKMAKYAFDMPYFREIIGTEYYEITGTMDEMTDSDTVRNTNYMMGEYNGGEYYYLYSLGGKTGNTGGAGRCLISYASKGDLDVVAITLGVPNEHDNYHLTDHIKLFTYVFDEFTDNITVDIGSEYKSVGIGEKIQITAITSEETPVIWTSSDETVATVNEYGVVAGKKLGQAKIIATTRTGNQDYAYVSVGFYNGIDVKYSAGPNDPNGILGYGPIDWKVVKNYGIDFAIIRAGYALDNTPDTDPYFVTNIKGASENDLNIMISFDGYATSKEYAEKEAEYLVNYLNETIPEYLNTIKLPIVYNLFNSSVSDIETLTNVIFAFKNKMNGYGYDVVVELGKTKLSTMDLETITNSGVDLYIIYRPYIPDFQKKMFATSGDTNYNADIWQYRTDAYFGDIGIGKKITMSVMYMDYRTMDTAHEKHEDELYSEKPTIRVDRTYVYTGADIVADVVGFDAKTMEIKGNVARKAGVYTITVRPKIKWKNGSTDAVSVTWEIKKAAPTFGKPVLKAEHGTVLKDISLPHNFFWQNEEAIVERDKENKFKALYIPNDTENYYSVEVELSVEVLPEKENGKVNVVVDDKKDKAEEMPTTLSNNDNNFKGYIIVGLSAVIALMAAAVAIKKIFANK